MDLKRKSEGSEHLWKFLWQQYGECFRGNKRGAGAGRLVETLLQLPKEQKIHVWGYGRGLKRPGPYIKLLANSIQSELIWDQFASWIKKLKKWKENTKDQGIPRKMNAFSPPTPV